MYKFVYLSIPAIIPNPQYALLPPPPLLPPPNSHLPVAASAELAVPAADRRPLAVGIALDIVTCALGRATQLSAVFGGALRFL